MKATFLSVFAAVLLSSHMVLAAVNPGTGPESPEDFRVEITGSAWLVNSGGAIQATGTPIDLVNDLGVRQQQPTFYGKFVFKPTRRQRIVLEGTPFALNGNNTVNRTLVYRGRTFNVSDTVKSNADLNYFFGGYQFDVLSGSAGHLGFSVGGAYLGATGTIQSLTANTTATKTQTIGLPLAGAEFRLFPIPGHHWLDLDGEVRGMGFGSYGHYVQATGNGGVWFGHFGLQGGYRAVNADLHETGNGGSGIAVRLKGPIFSLAFKW
jgi:hypothetical protein